MEFSNDLAKVLACKVLTTDATCKADTNCALAPIPVTICFLGKMFNQIKFLPATSLAWFSGDDNLNGAYATGIQGDSTAEW